MVQHQWRKFNLELTSEADRGGPIVREYPVILLLFGKTNLRQDLGKVIATGRANMQMYKFMYTIIIVMMWLTSAHAVWSSINFESILLFDC